MNNVIQPTQFSAYTAIAEVNGSYLYNTHYAPIQEPLSGPIMGLMMLISTLQYQPSPGPAYSTAMSQASRAAFIVSGGQALQDKMVGYLSKNGESTAKTAIHSVGLTDTQVGASLGIAKAFRDRQINVNGPRIYLIKTHLTLTPDNGIITLKYDW